MMPKICFVLLFTATFALAFGEPPVEIDKPTEAKQAKKAKAVAAQKQKAEKPGQKKPKPVKAKPKEAEPKSEPKKEDEEKPKPTVKVKQEPFKSVLEISGVIEGTSKTPISVTTKSWSSLAVKEVVEHGTKVRKGDVLLRLDTEDLILAIEDQEAALPLSQLQLENEKASLDESEQTFAIEKEARIKARKRRQDDFEYYKEVSHPMEIRNVKERLKSAEDYLAYSEEELRQLTKMYENDDVTEETEEIILRRARDAVERDRWSVERTRVSTERSLQVTIPRAYESRVRSLKLDDIRSRDEEEMAARSLEIKRMEVAKQERDLAKAEEKFRHLRNDLKNMIVHAPADGIIYYGASKRGKWTTAATVEKKLIPGGRIGNGEILFTLVDPTKLQVRAAVPEDKLKELEQGQKGDAVMKWNSEAKLPAEVKKISYVPMTNSTFDTVFSIDSKNSDLPVMPGMNTTVKITTHDLDKAITVPKTAVKKEDEKHYVLMKDGKKRWVELGPANENRQVIKKGLKPGEDIQPGSSSSDGEKK